MPWRCEAYLAAALGLISGESPEADTTKAFALTPELAASYLQHSKFASRGNQQLLITSQLLQSCPCGQATNCWPKKHAQADDAIGCRKDMAYAHAPVVAVTTD
jgi:hypothetical protein